jgi:hypothetical protein
MSLTKRNLWQRKRIVTAIVALAHITALIVSSLFIYLAWDGGAIIRQMHSPTLTAEVYRAIYEHYFPGVANPDWAPLSIFIGISNVLNLYVVAPLALMVTTVELGIGLTGPRRWLLTGGSVLVIGLLLWHMPTLRLVAVILD